MESKSLQTADDAEAMNPGPRLDIKILRAIAATADLKDGDPTDGVQWTPVVIDCGKDT